MKTLSGKYSAYTLIELMIAISLSLVLLLGVTQMFHNVGSTINDTQSTLNMAANLNSTALQLRRDLGEVTANLAPLGQLVGAEQEGYFEINEGMNLPISLAALAANSNGRHLVASYLNASNQRISNVFANTEISSTTGDFTPGDVDDILAFTAKKTRGFYRGRIDGTHVGLDEDTVAESMYAEIIWFVRGNTLYRRQLLVDPDRFYCMQNRRPATYTKHLPTTLTTVGNDFYAKNDLSVRYDGSSQYLPNKLNDLARREHRFAHRGVVASGTATEFPFPLYHSGYEGWYFFGLPLLEEQATNSSNSSDFLPGRGLPNLNTGTNYDQLYFNGLQAFNNSGVRQILFRDPWSAPNVYKEGGNVWSQNQDSGSLTTYVNNIANRSIRTGEDIILTNVLSFDVKVWNPYWVPCVRLGATQGAGASSGTNDAWKWAPPQYVDLGQNRFLLKVNDTSQTDHGQFVECEVNFQQNHQANFPTGIPTDASLRGFGFCSRGHYAGTTTNIDSERIPTTTFQYDRDPSNNYFVFNKNRWTGPAMPCVFDTWSRYYEENPNTFKGSRASTISEHGSYSGSDPRPIYTSTDPGTGLNSLNQDQTDGSNWECPPPYDEKLSAVQITIRCFDPASGNIRQIRVVQNF